jgi:hypothetical protein
MDVFRQGFGVQHERSAKRAGIGGDDGDLDNPWPALALTLPMHSISGACKE